MDLGASLGTTNPVRSGARRDEIALAIDLGGTQYRVAAITRDAQMIARLSGLTRADEEPDVVIQDLADAVDAIRGQVVGRTILGVGIIAPGPLDPSTGIVFQCPNLPRWHNVPLADELEARVGLPTYLGNDANLAALAEARHGAGRGAQHLVYLTVSTGVGSGVVVDGQLLLGEHGAGAEAGHMALSFDGPLCSCGNHGCLEAYASGTSLVRRAREALDGGRASSLRELAEIDAIDVATAAEQGDGLAQELIEQAGRALGLGVRNLLHIFNPSVVVIGGGVSRIGPRLWDPMWQVVNSDALTTYRQDLRIVPAELGDDSGLMGAAILVHEARAHTPEPRGE